MKKLLSISAVAVALLVGTSAKANAALLVTVTGATGATISCDTSVGCAGFLTSVAGSNVVTISGTFDGYFLLNSTVSANLPGSATTGFTTSSETNVTHLSGAGDLIIDWSAVGFTLPTGPDYTFSASQTANWVSSSNTDSVAFTAWARADNGTGPGGVAAATPTIVSPGGTTTPAPSQSGDLAFNDPAVPYSIVGRLAIHQALSTLPSLYTQTAIVTAVPEPASLMLLGTGLAGAAIAIRRRRRK